MKKVEELKDLGCSVRGRFYDLAWSKPVLRAPAVHGVSSYKGGHYEYVDGPRTPHKSKRGILLLTLLKNDQGREWIKLPILSEPDFLLRFIGIIGRNL